MATGTTKYNDTVGRNMTNYRTARAARNYVRFLDVLCKITMRKKKTNLTLAISILIFRWNSFIDYFIHVAQGT